MGAAHQIAVDHAVLVQAEERAEALPRDLLHALHLRERATVSGVGAGGAEGAVGATAPELGRNSCACSCVMGRTVKYLGSRHSSMYL